MSSAVPPPPAAVGDGVLHDWSAVPGRDVVDAAARRVMAVHAHPDDEASKGAATIRMLHEAGARSVLVTCTGGEEGEILNPHAAHLEGEDMRDVRHRELAAAARIIGYDAVYLLGYRDSGMPDSEANARPDAFWNADFDTALARLVHVVRAERPHVLLGYDEHEQYPHPDHIQAHRLTMAAWNAAADPDYRAPDGFDVPLGAPWQVRKLYWFHWSVTRIRRLHEAFEANGWESPFGKWIEGLGDVPDVATTRLDVGDWLTVARDALVAHQSQIAPDGFWLRLPDDEMRNLWPYEEYVLVRNVSDSDPSPAAVEDDLFAGVTDA